MKDRAGFYIFTFFEIKIATFLLIVIFPLQAIAQSTSDFVGTWENVSSGNIDSKGTETYSFGQHATGLLMFDSHSNFVLIVGNPDSRKFSSDNLLLGTTDENRTAVSGTMAFFGKYSASDDVVSMQIEYCNFPNWTDTNRKRVILYFKGDEFKWTFSSASTDALAEETWRRVK